MAGRKNVDSDSPPPRSKDPPRRGREATARSENDKHTERGRERDHSRRENDKDTERGRERDHSRRERDSGRFRERDNNAGHHARESGLDERHRSRGRDRDPATGRDIDPATGRDREGYRDRDRDRGRDRDRDKKDRDRDNARDLDHSKQREKKRDMERVSDTEIGRVKRSHPSSSSPPYEASRTAAAVMRDEALNHYKEELRLDGAEDSLVKMKAVEAHIEETQKSKEKPSFEYSGKLAAETNKVRGVTLQFTEPPEARKPTVRWRLYIFKDGEPLNEPLYIHRLSCYLFGRERRVADVPTDHPSCSKQHAVIQYRLVEKVEVDGTNTNEVRPYLMDLGSTNGTFLNGERLESERYYELFEKDTVKFGNSSREYVLLHEHSVG